MTSYLFGVTLGLLREISLILNFPGLGAGELRVLLEEVSDLAGEGLARTGTSNLAGLAEFDGIVIGLSRGEEVAVATLFIAEALVALPAAFPKGEQSLEGFMFSPEGRHNCSCKDITLSSDAAFFALHLHLYCLPSNQ